jgi:hypothetical protein
VAASMSAKAAAGDMCGRPLRCKWKVVPPGRGAVMCPAC